MCLERNTKPVLIAAPVRDRDFILREYLDALSALEYPKDKIGFYFLLNDSSDASEEILIDFKKRNLESGYREITIEKAKIGAPKDRRVHNVRLQIYANLARLRNHLLSKIGDYDFLFSVDSDIVVKPNALEVLVHADKDICSLVIANDYEQGRLCNIMEWSGEPDAKGNQMARHIKRFSRDKFFKVDVTGAVYLLKSDVCKQIRYGWDKQGEDIAFCRNAQREGFEIWTCSMIAAHHKMKRH